MLRAHRPWHRAATAVAAGVVVLSMGARPGGAPSRAAALVQPELTLPFEGIWGVVQGFDSGATHQGYAAFALDFAPPQDVDQFARLAHPRLRDFACYGRPVLAPADGRVVRVATGFPDLAPYAKDGPKIPTGNSNRNRSRSRSRTQPGSGNFVIIQHATRVYSELVHLQAGSVRVAAGQAVRRGEAIGACGNSGNARTPHLHLGLLTSIAPITTGRMKLARYEVRGPDGRWTPGDGEPKQGQWVRPASSVGHP